MKNALLLAAVAALFALAIPAPSGAEPTPTTIHRTTICHFTSSPTNPYLELTLDDEALATHSTHHGDIIPAPPGGCPTSLTTTTKATTTTTALGTTTSSTVAPTTTTTVAPTTTTTTKATTTIPPTTPTTKAAVIVATTQAPVTTIPVTVAPARVLAGHGEAPEGNAPRQIVSQPLARTGSPTAWLVAIGLALIGAGICLTLWKRQGDQPC